MKKESCLGASVGLSAFLSGPFAGVMFVTEELHHRFGYNFVSLHAVPVSTRQGCGNKNIMSDLVIIAFSVEHTAFELRAEIAKLQKEYLIVGLR